MSILKKIGKVMRDPGILLMCLIQTPCISSIIADKPYLKTVFRLSMHKKLNLQTPETFNEKLQWLKLNDRKPEYTMMVDKYAVREYIAKKIGEEYLIPLLGVWEDPDDIDFDKLPDKFVLKCNHNSGLGMCICKDKSKLDIKKVRKELKKGLKQDYYLTGREWVYKNVMRKIIAEQYMTDESGELADYKVHNFNGEPKVVLVCRDRFKKTGRTEDFFTDTWEHINVKRPLYNNASSRIKCPANFDKMLQLSAELSKGIDFLRTDFYVINDKIYFGELTFYPASGFEKFEPDYWDYEFGKMINLDRE